MSAEIERPADAPAEGTRVTCEDILTGESESKVIRDDYVIVTDGRMAVAAMQVYANGTVQVTLKRSPASALSADAHGLTDHDEEET